MSKQLVTKSNRLNIARQIEESITEPANTAYYMFLGNHLEYDDPSNIPQPNDSVYETSIDIYRNMLYGKRISANNVKLMITRNDYVSNTVYDMYDDRAGEENILLFDANYYAIVNADSQYHVFKCLDNNNGAPSTVAPEFAEVDVSDEFYQTSDGYVWKYMYSVSDTIVREFATSDYFPCVPNTQVANAAIDGSINVIKIESAGRGYDNYCTGTFRTQDLRLNGNTFLYAIDASTTASTISNFYKDCYIYISSGTGAGSYSKINQYLVNSTSKTIYLDTSFSVPPAADSVFEISPGVEIKGDGTQTINAVARAIVNTTGNSIQTIEMLSIGAGYKYAAANVVAHPVVGVSANAVLRPIYSPPGGHGADAAKELGARSVCFSVKFSANDIGIPLTNSYRTIGVLRDPKFDNVVLNLTGANGTFLGTERIHKAQGVLISNAVAINTLSSVVTGGIDFQNQFTQGEYIYFTTDSGSQVAVVNSIINSSALTISSNGYYDCSSAQMFKTDIISSLNEVSLNYSALTGTLSVNTTSNTIVGTSTEFTTELVANSSHLFIYANTLGGGELLKVTSIANDTSITVSSNCSFVNSAAKAQVINYTINTSSTSNFSDTTGIITTVSVGSLTLTDVSGVFRTGDMIIGERSGATASVTSVERSGVTKGFDNFVQMYKYQGTVSSGSFAQNELVYQSIDNTLSGQFANAYLHSVVVDGSNTEFYVTNQIGIINTGNNMIGANSGAVAAITHKYSPEVIFGSGDILFIENLDGITRSAANSETIRIIFEF